MLFDGKDEEFGWLCGVYLQAKEWKEKQRPSLFQVSSVDIVIYKFFHEWHYCLANAENKSIGQDIKNKKETHTKRRVHSYSAYDIENFFLS